MVNRSVSSGVAPALPRVGVLVGIYLGVVLLTLAALAVMSVIAPDQATEHAWGHAIVVAVFAVLLPLRLRSAQRGRRGAIRAVGIIAAVLLVANVVEALLPGFVPDWMRGEMILVALLMLGVVAEVVRWGAPIRTGDATAAGWATITTVSVPAAASGPAPRAGRQRLSADQRRAQVFAATADVIASNGYANVTLTEVARRAGIAKGLVWHYFSDRDDLMQQTLGHLGDRIRDAVVDDLAVSAPAPDVMREVVRRTALLTRTHRAELDAMAQIVQSLRTSDGKQRITVRAYDATYGEHRRLLARGQAEGTIRPGDPRVMAVVYQGAIDAMIGYLQAHPDVDPEAEAQAVADVLLSGFTAR